MDPRRPAPYRFITSPLPTNSIRQLLETWTIHPKPLQEVGQAEVDLSGAVHVEGGLVTCTMGLPAQFVLYADDPNRDFRLTWARKCLIYFYNSVYLD
jgi:hypothetical protein